MKQSRILSVVLYLIVSCFLDMHARDNRIDFTVFAPGFSHQLNHISKFQSAVSDQSNRQFHNEQKAQLARTVRLLQPEISEQKTEYLGFLGRWWKNRQNAKQAKIAQKALTVVTAKKAHATASTQSQILSTTTKSRANSQEIYRLRERNNKQISKISGNQGSSFQKVMDKRSKAFASSINNPKPATERIKINSQASAFLQVQGIDTTQFQQIEGLPIQHQLTHELVDVLDVVANYAQHHQHEICQTHLTKYCAHLASLSQQSNIEGALEQAINGTNCCHGIAHYLEGMVFGVAQAYQQFHAALDYFDAVADLYGDWIVQYGAQGAMVANCLEAIVTAGMIAAPTATAAVTGVMIGATVYVMAPLCLQAMIDTVAFGGACITGDWDKITSDLNSFGKFISSRETVACMAELAGGAAMPTPNLSCVVDQVLSLRPVITSVQNVSGEMVQSLYLMTKNQLQKVYTQGLELLQLPEFTNFNMKCESIGGFNFFDILPKSHQALAVAMEGIEAGLFNFGEQVTLTSLLAQSESSMMSDAITSSVLKTPSIEQITSSLRRRVFDFVRRGIGLENLSDIELELIAKTVKPGKNFQSKNCDLSKADVKFSKNSNHIFDNREGHQPDSPEFRMDVINCVKNVEYHVGPDIRDNQWFEKVLSDGTQLWVQVRGDTIINCGTNEVSRKYNCITGLSSISRK